MDDIQAESVTVSLLCSLDTLLIHTPARGSLCTHLQCFSLHNYVTAMSRVSPRKWRCPICKAKCLRLYIDAYQLAILQLIRQKGIHAHEITFDLQARVREEAVQAHLDAFVATLPPYMLDNSNRQFSLEVLRKKEGVGLVKSEEEEPPLRKQLCRKKEQWDKSSPQFRHHLNAVGYSANDAILID